MRQVRYSWYFFAVCSHKR